MVLFFSVELVLNYNELGSESLIFAFVRDVSERRRSEGELKDLMLTEDGLRQQFEEAQKERLRHMRDTAAVPDAIRGDRKLDLGKYS